MTSQKKHILPILRPATMAIAALSFVACGDGTGDEGSSSDGAETGGNDSGPQATGGAQLGEGSGGAQNNTGGTESSSGGAASGTGGAGSAAGGTLTSSGGALDNTGGSEAGSGGLANGSGGELSGSGGAPDGSGGMPGGEPTFDLIGWAATSACGPNGTTGGGDQTPVEVNGGDLQDALEGSDSKVIHFSGEASGFSVTASNKTVIGVGDAHVRGGFRLGSGSRNLIFKNISFSGGEDAIEVSGGECIWFDHLDVYDAEDGNMDLVRGSDLITISWSKFYYVEKSHSHRLSNLNGNKASDTPGKINFTFHHNWWGQKVLQRMPRVRHGKVHVFNNYYSSQEAQYYVGLSDHAKLVVENNFAEYDASDAPVEFFNTDGTEIVLSGNDFGSTDGSEHATGEAFNPSEFYDYSLQTAQQARESVMAHAGVQPN